MGKSLSLTVVAEGVEPLKQHDFLCEHACNEMQGHYFGKPVAADEFSDLLRAHQPALPADRKSHGVAQQKRHASPDGFLRFLSVAPAQWPRASAQSRHGPP